MIITIWITIVLLAIGYAVLSKTVYENRDNIKSNLSYIKENNELINKNAQLINIINIMLSHSELKIDWEKYAGRLRKLGIIVDDTWRNQDIEDPEG